MSTGTTTLRSGRTGVEPVPDDRAADEHCVLPAVRFPNASAGFGEDYVHGPAFYDWLQTSEVAHWLKDDPVLQAERADVEPNTYTSRALYGAYLT